MDADGYIFIVDRIKDMIITGGENVFPREVEEALLDMPGVQEAAVFDLPDERWVQRVAAALVSCEPVTRDDACLYTRDHPSLITQADVMQHAALRADVLPRDRLISGGDAWEISSSAAAAAAEEFQQQVQATLLTAEDLAEVIFGVNCWRLQICLLTAALQVRIRYIEEIEQPLREEIGDLRQRLGQEQVR